MYLITIRTKEILYHFIIKEQLFVVFSLEVFPKSFETFSNYFLMKLKQYFSKIKTKCWSPYPQEPKDSCEHLILDNRKPNQEEAGSKSVELLIASEIVKKCPPYISLSD
jgi:hypothetical protein